MANRGFSLIQVLIAGSIMIGIALALNSFVSNLAKSRGDMDRHWRYRDLVEDVRFQFQQPILCEEALTSLAQNGTLSLSAGTLLSAGAPIPEYGVKIIRFTLESVSQVPARSKQLRDRNGRARGTYLERCRMVDLFVEATQLTSGWPLKRQRIARIASVQRSGALADRFCYRVEAGAACPL